MQNVLRLSYCIVSVYSNTLEPCAKFGVDVHTKIYRNIMCLLCHCTSTHIHAVSLVNIALGRHHPPVISTGKPYFEWTEISLDRWCTGKNIWSKTGLPKLYIIEFY